MRLALVLLLCVLFSSVGFAADMGDWAYQDIVKVKNNYAGTLLTNNSLAIDLENDFNLELCYLDGDCQADGDDLRLVYQDNEIPYFVEHQNGKPKYLWFQIQAEIPALEVDDQYYLYYSNPTAVAPNYTVELPLPAPDSFTYALYHFDEGSGTNAEDVFGHSPFSLSQSSMWEPSPWGNAVKFDSTTKTYGSTPNPLYEPTDEATVEFWTHIDSPPPALYAVGPIGNTSYSEYLGGYMLSYVHPNLMYLRIFPGDIQVVTPISFEPLRWHHLAASWGDSGMAISKDGELLVERYPDPAINPWAVNYHTIIGIDSRLFLPPPSGYPSLDGAMDELRISTKRRTIFPQPEINLGNLRPTILSVEGIPDQDSDGIEDWQDNCLGTPLGEEVSAQGCSCSQLCAGWENPCYDSTCNLEENSCDSGPDNTNTCGVARVCKEDSCVIKPSPSYWYLEDWSDSGHDYCSDGNCIAYECKLLSSEYSVDCDPTTELQEQINTLETENSGLKSRLGIVEGENTEQWQQIGDLQTENTGQGQQIGEHSQQIGDLEQENTEQGTRIGSLEQETAAQASDISSLMDESSSLAARVLSLEVLAAQQSGQIAGILAEITGIKASLAALQETVSYLSDQVDFITWVLRNRFFGNPADKYKSICDWMKTEGKTDTTILGTHCQIVDSSCMCEEV